MENENGIAGGLTFANQGKLPKLPLPSLEETCKNYLKVLEPLQVAEAHEKTKQAVEEFLRKEGPLLQEKLAEYAENRNSYIEDFWYDTFLKYDESVVLNLNPFFVLEDDPTPSRNNKISRAASLVSSTIKFILALRSETLPPDEMRGTPLCMAQFRKLFGTCRVPTEGGCSMSTKVDSNHIIVLCRNQFYWFDVIDDSLRACISERQLAENFALIEEDAVTTDGVEACRSAVGVLTTESRPVWANLRELLRESSTNNEKSLKVVDEALFVVCLDNISCATAEEVANNVLCGSYSIKDGVQMGSCMNRWYDKLQIIVSENGAAGVNFEHAGVDGHTVLRFVSDVFTDTILRFARSINSQINTSLNYDVKFDLDESRIVPTKLEWELSAELKTGVRFAESRLSDLICQHEVKILEFKDYGKQFITSMNLSPDAFVQMAFQAAYYGLYGVVTTTYEPVLTKRFFHGRTEAIRSVSMESKAFVEVFCSEASSMQKLAALRKAVAAHVAQTKRCSMGKGVDRHLYALKCLAASDASDKLPLIFRDSGFSKLCASTISTSNCGNPSLRLFGFGPVVPDGFGIGYIIKDNGIQFCVSSRHRQTERYLSTLKRYLLEVRDMLRAEKETNFPHMMGKNQLKRRKSATMLEGYGFFDAGSVDSVRGTHKSPRVGRRLK